MQINCSKLVTDSGSTDDSESVSTFSSIYRSKLPTETNKADSIESDSKPSSNSAIPTTITTIEPYVGPFIFEDNTKIAGIDFDPKHPRQQRFPLGSGVVIFDYNNDDLDDIYIGDAIGKIRKIDITNNIISTIGGSGIQGYSGDGEISTKAKIGCPSSIVVDNNNNVYFTDSAFHVIRKIDTDGIRHSAKIAWRALAHLQKEIENDIQ